MRTDLCLHLGWLHLAVERWQTVVKVVAEKPAVVEPAPDIWPFFL